MKQTFNSLKFFLIIISLSLSFFYSAHARAVNSEVSEGEIYISSEGEYVDIDGVTYGPYAKIGGVNIFNNKEEKSWFFTYFENLLDCVGDICFYEKYYYVHDSGSVTGPYQTKDGEIYIEGNKKYFRINNVIYGPYEDIDNLQVNDRSFGFRYYENQAYCYGNGSCNYDNYSYVINGETFGPYSRQDTYIPSFVRSYVSDNRFAFVYGEDYNKFFTNINGEVLGPCESFESTVVTNNNYGLSCYSFDDVKNNFLYINGDKINNPKARNLKIKENNWGYQYEDDLGEYVVVNNDIFGPYDKVNDLEISNNNWAFAYKKNGEYFILADRKPPFKLLIKEEDIESDKHGIFYPQSKIPICQSDCNDKYRDNKIEMDNDHWYLKYNIAGREVRFTNKISEYIITSNNLYEKLNGKIILKVEDAGKAYYVHPTNKKAHYLGRPDDAFRVMREQGVGVSENDYNDFNIIAPKRLSGAILLRVKNNGEAYYVNPEDLKLHYLGRPADAFDVMRNLGLGISNNDFNSMIE